MKRTIIYAWSRFYSIERSRNYVSIECFGFVCFVLMNQSFLFTKGTLFFQVGDALGVSAISAGCLGVGGWVTPSKKYLWGLILENLKRSFCSKTQYFATNFDHILISMAIKWTIEFNANYVCFHAVIWCCEASKMKIVLARMKWLLKTAQRAVQHYFHQNYIKWATGRPALFSPKLYQISKERSSWIWKTYGS